MLVPPSTWREDLSWDENPALWVLLLIDFKKEFFFASSHTVKCIGGHFGCVCVCWGVIIKENTEERGWQVSWQRKEGCWLSALERGKSFTFEM